MIPAPSWTSGDGENLGLQGSGGDYTLELDDLGNFGGVVAIRPGRCAARTTAEYRRQSRIRVGTVVDESLFAGLNCAGLPATFNVNGVPCANLNDPTPEAARARGVLRQRVQQALGGLGGTIPACDGFFRQIPGDPIVDRFGFPPRGYSLDSTREVQELGFADSDVYSDGADWVRQRFVKEREPGREQWVTPQLLRIPAFREALARAIFAAWSSGA